MAKRSAPRLEEIAAEVGRLFGTTEAHARRWLHQRNTMLEALHLVRGKATDLIDELSGKKRRQFKRRAVAQALRQVPVGHPAEATMAAREPADVCRDAREDAAAKKRWPQSGRTVSGG